jgi:hypothetical protein
VLFIRFREVRIFDSSRRDSGGAMNAPSLRNSKGIGCCAEEEVRMGGWVSGERVTYAGYDYLFHCSAQCSPRFGHDHCV